MRALILAGALSLAALGAFADDLKLEISHSKAIKLSGDAVSVVVGNAAVADVIVQNNRVLLVVGKNVGTTHFMAVDEQGRTLYSGEILVSAPNESGTVTIQRGKETYTQLCQTRCVDTPSPESSTTALNDAVNKNRQISTNAKGN